MNAILLCFCYLVLYFFLKVTWQYFIFNCLCANCACVHACVHRRALRLGLEVNSPPIALRALFALFTFRFVTLSLLVVNDD
jgi:hypothetical protein